MRFTQEQMEILATKLQNGSLTLHEFLLLLQEPTEPKCDIQYVPCPCQPPINPYPIYPPYFTTTSGYAQTHLNNK